MDLVVQKSVAPKNKTHTESTRFGRKGTKSELSPRRRSADHPRNNEARTRHNILAITDAPRFFRLSDSKPKFEGTERCCGSASGYEMAGNDGRAKGYLKKLAHLQ